MKIDVLSNYLNALLQPERFSDYCPSGLQVEGRPEINKIVTGVTASGLASQCRCNICASRLFLAR